MTTANSHMKSLYSKLQTVGYNPKYIQSLLPDWWDDAIADTPAGLQQASLILGQRFGVHAETLWTETAEAALRLPQGICFKRRDNVESDDLNIACAVAHSLARIVLKAFPAKQLPDFYPDASELRRQLLTDKPWISFQDLLQHCLDFGIPVIHLNHLPRNTKKMEGLAFQHNGRPVIVLTGKRTHGYLLFDLAHELGHITLGHVTANRAVIDQEIDSQADDNEESAANRFALELITGDPGCRIVPNGRNLSGNQLASAASIFAEKHRIDPVHIALNYAHTQKCWPVANLAIKLLTKNTPTDQQILCETLLKTLNMDELSEDDSALLQTHLSGIVD